MYMVQVNYTKGGKLRINCEICHKEFKSIQKLSHHIRMHKIMVKEYYDTYMKTYNEGICPVCGKETTFRGLSTGYLECCSSKCSNNYNIDKIKQTKFNRYGSSTYNNSAKAKDTCTKRYGVSSILKISEVHAKGIKAAHSAEADNKRNQTNLIKYGTINVYASEFAKNKIKQTNINKYGTAYVTQNSDIIDKIQSTNLKKYGVVCNLNTNEVKQKAKSKEAQIKRSNTLRGKPKHSKLESLFENKLNELGYIKDQDYYCQYRSVEYPFMCDFYLVQTNTYIEINGYWMHNSHAFDKSNPDDIAILNSWKEKSKQSKQYQYAIHIWTKSDPEKRKYGQKLNFIELWTISDIINYIAKLKEVN